MVHSLTLGMALDTKGDLVLHNPESGPHNDLWAKYWNIGWFFYWWIIASLVLTGRFRGTPPVHTPLLLQRQCTWLCVGAQARPLFSSKSVCTLPPWKYLDPPLLKYTWWEHTCMGHLQWVPPPQKEESSRGGGYSHRNAIRGCTAQMSRFLTKNP